MTHSRPASSRTRHALVLSPRDPDASPRRQDVIDALRAVDVLGPPLENGGGRRFLVGNRFFELVTFLGCSPNVRVEPPAPDEQEGGKTSGFCYLEIDGPHAVPQFFGGDNTRAPACPSCGRQLVDWEGVLYRWQEDGAYQSSCSACGESVSPPTLNWRRRAGVARSVIYIWNVHEAEAVPSDPFFSALHRATGCEWSYFYLTQRTSV